MSDERGTSKAWFLGVMRGLWPTTFTAELAHELWESIVHQHDDKTQDCIGEIIDVCILQPGVPLVPFDPLLFARLVTVVLRAYIVNNIKPPEFTALLATRARELSGLATDESSREMSTQMAALILMQLRGELLA